MGARVHGCMGVCVWVYVCMGGWVWVDGYGCMAVCVWVYGCLGVWVEWVTLHVDYVGMGVGLT